jgi:antitoxin component YwqK of YwqJK toxin-antitoxin module
MFPILISAEELNGLQKEYYEDGSVHYERMYKNGQIDGVVKEYYKDGTLKAGMYFENGVVNGEFRKYFPNGQLGIELSMKNDKRQGEYKSYYKNGALMEDGMFNEGKTEGNFKEYYENGNVKMDYFYKNDKKNGLCKEFHKNGSIRAKWIYKDGALQGISYVFNKSGEVKAELQYENDKREGLCKEFYNNGSISEEWNYKNGVLQGISYVFNKNGEIIAELQYENDKMVKRTKSNTLTKIGKALYIHPGTKMKFPKRVGKFKKDKIEIYDKKTKNVGIHYYNQDRKAPVTISVFNYPKPKGVDLQQFINQEFQKSIEFVESENNYRPIGDVEDTVLVQEAKTYHGKHLETSHEWFFASKNRMVQDRIYIFNIGDWMVKYMITYDSEHKTSAEIEVKRFLQDLKLP